MQRVAKTLVADIADSKFSRLLHFLKRSKKHLLENPIEGDWADGGAGEQPKKAARVRSASAAAPCWTVGTSQ